jgi:hypothetical protein
MRLFSFFRFPKSAANALRGSPPGAPLPLQKVFPRRAVPKDFPSLLRVSTPPGYFLQNAGNGRSQQQESGLSCQKYVDI